MCMNHTVGEAIRRIRISNGMTQEAMAELMESGLRNYQNIEAGKAWPNYKMIANLVERLHIDPACPRSASGRFARCHKPVLRFHNLLRAGGAIRRKP